MVEAVQEVEPDSEGILKAELARTRERLDALSLDLEGVESELEQLSERRQQYALLEQLCSSLESLDEMGAGQLFWGDLVAPGEGRQRIVALRARVGEFQKEVDEVEERREAVLVELHRAQEGAEFIEDDLYQLRVEAEQKKFEWVVEREADPLPLREMVMPWSRNGEDDRRFRKALLAALFLSLLLGWLIPLIDVPLPDLWEVEEVPERLTRLIREEPPPPPAEPEPVLAETKPEEQQPELASEEQAAPEVETPKETVASKGILAFREKFSALAESAPAARLGSQARIRSPGEAASGLPQRSLIASQAAGDSGGIDIGAISRDVGGGGDAAIAGVQVARATSEIGAGGGSDRPLSGDGPSAARTDEEIQIVFDRHKAALYRLYNRELRRNPTLRGQMVLRMTIEPDGSVSLCELHSSDMNAPRLSKQVLDRVRGFDFGAKDDIPAITILYPIDFLPAA